MNYRHILHPAVYGTMGDGTRLDQTVHPPVVHHLHLVLDSPPRDDLHTVFPCFLVSGQLGRHIVDTRLTGVELADLEVEWNEQYLEDHPDDPTPEIRWLKVVSRTEDTDFRLDSENRLEVSDPAMETLRRFNLNECLVHDAAMAPSREKITEDLWEEAKRTAERLRRAKDNS